MLDTGAPDADPDPDAMGSQMLTSASFNEIDVSIGMAPLTGRVFEETDVVDRRSDPELDRAWVGDCKNERD